MLRRMETTQGTDDREFGRVVCEGTRAEGTEEDGTREEKARRSRRCVPCVARAQGAAATGTIVQFNDEPVR